MIVQCPQCQTKYRLAESKLAGRPEIRLRCRKCGTTFPARAQQPAPPPPSPVVTTAPGTDAPPPSAEATAVDPKARGPQLPGDKNVTLAAIDGPLKGKTFPITKPRVILGRAGVDIVVTDKEISRQHCALEVHRDAVMLVDLGSTNGTFVDGERIESHELEHLSEFRIGETTFILTLTHKAS
ncbi:MAG: FHA domain-containing protein [Terriglobia bacterium]